MIFILLFVLLLLALIFFKGKVELKGYVAEATIALVLGTLIMGSFQMHELEKQDRAKFLLDLKKSFYEEDCNRGIISAIEKGKLKIVPDTSERGKLPVNEFYEAQADEYLINFDYMNIFIKKGMLDEQDVYWVFGWYVRHAWANNEVRAYIKRIRKDEKSVYSNFEELSGKMDEMWKVEDRGK